MQDDLRPTDTPPPTSSAALELAARPVLRTALPAAAFTASLLFDVLGLVAESREQAYSDNRRAVELLKVGLSASLAGLGLGLVDALKVPAAVAGGDATQALALEGAVVAIYLLDLAARQKQLGSGPTGASAQDFAGIGLSLTGLALLAASRKQK